jgi:lactate dehydrogenase-like 2-hydroxyacid dehydrogenase
MTQLVLWPATRWRDDHRAESDALGAGLEAAFAPEFSSVTDEQWHRCCAVVTSLDIPLEYRPLLSRCRILVAPRVGYDGFDLEGWGKAGIPVCNVPDYGVMEVADHVMGFMLALIRGIEFHNRELLRDFTGNWRPTVNPFGKRLSTCTFGIIGLGRIGTAVAMRARAFGMQVRFYDPYRPSGSELALGIGRAHTLPELLASADVVSLHTPLTNDTRNMIDAEALAHARPQQILINTARGALIDMDALHESLRSGRLRAAALDVLPQEPPTNGHPLLQAWFAEEAWIRHRLLLTPHSAYLTPESAYDKRAKGARVAARYLREGMLENCVNTEFLRFRR